jgi:cytochrome c oxidase subunit 1
MAMAGIFGLYAASYYWFPLITATRTHPGRLMSEPLGHLHFWTTLIGAYAVFLPMHLTGLAGEPRHYAQLTGIPGPGGSLSPAGTLLAQTIPLNHFITYAAIFLATAQLPFLFNLVRSLRQGEPTSSNPWQATTLEWHPALNPFPPSSASDTPESYVYRTPCHYHSNQAGFTFLPQWIPDSVTRVEIKEATNAKPE